MADVVRSRAAVGIADDGVDVSEVVLKRGMVTARWALVGFSSCCNPRALPWAFEFAAFSRIFVGRCFISRSEMATVRRRAADG
jgi:hypothetical protein